MKLVNLTPHDVTVILDEEGVIITIPASGDVARVEKTRRYTGTICGIPVYDTAYSDVSGLPEPVENVRYIVSNMTAQAVPDRMDVLCPDTLLYADDGRVIGCTCLRRV